MGQSGDRCRRWASTGSAAEAIAVIDRLVAGDLVGTLVSDAILRRIRPEQFREVILLVVTSALLPSSRPRFRTISMPRTSTGSPRASPITLVVAVGQVLVVLTRNIDLSVSSMVGLSAYVVGTLLTRSRHPAARRRRDLAWRSVWCWAPSTA